MFLAIAAIYYAVVLLGSRSLPPAPQFPIWQRAIISATLVLVPVVNLVLFVTGLETLLIYALRAISAMLGWLELAKLAMIYAQLVILDKLHAIRGKK